MTNKNPIAEAIRLLTESADEYRRGISIGDVPDWAGEPETKAAYDETMTVAAGLRGMVERNATTAGELSDKQLNIIGAPWHFNLLVTKEKAEVFAFARAVITADRAQRQAEPVARPDDEGHHGFAHAGPFQGVTDRIIGMIRERRQAAQEPHAPLIDEGDNIAHPDDDTAPPPATQAVQEPAFYVHESALVELKDVRIASLGTLLHKSKQARTVPLYATPQPAQAPEGYKLVPLEPTQAMLTAAKAWLVHYQHMRDGDKVSARAQAYRAMLAAAPDHSA